MDLVSCNGDTGDQRQSQIGGKRTDLNRGSTDIGASMGGYAVTHQGSISKGRIRE